MPQKIYVIEPPKSSDRSMPSEPFVPLPPPSRTEPRQRRSPAATSTAKSGDRWVRVLRAYLLGPLALILWPKGRFRLAWTIVGAGSIFMGALLLLQWSFFTTRLETASNGVLLWVIVVTSVLLLTFTAWSRAVAVAGRDHPTLAALSSRRLRHPLTVGTFGFFMPGLGLLIAGQFRRAACVLWMIGPLAAALAILAHWRWLWERSQSTVSPGISGTALEIVLITAAVTTAAVSLTWIVQALDGARRFSGTSHSRMMADLASVALLASLTLFYGAFRPVSVAQSLGAASVTLHEKGFRLIPLGMCEAAARLDPARPGYLANAAVLYDELGMKDAALDKRAIIERRTQEHIDLARRNDNSEQMTMLLSFVADQTNDGMAPLTADDTWTRIRRLLRNP